MSQEQTGITKLFWVWALSGNAMYTVFGSTMGERQEIMKMKMITMFRKCTLCAYWGSQHSSPCPPPPPHTHVFMYRSKFISASDTFCRDLKERVARGSWHTYLSLHRRDRYQQCCILGLCYPCRNPVLPFKYFKTAGPFAVTPASLILSTLC